MPAPPAASRPVTARSPSALRVLPLALGSAALIGLASYWGPTAARLGLEGGEAAAVDDSTAGEAPGPDDPEEVFVAPAAPEPLAIEVAVLPPPAAAARPAPSRPVASEETVERLEVPALEDLTLPALEVSSVPELDVAVDGKPLGRTPFKKVMLPGRRTLTLTSKALGIRATREVEVKAQGITRLEVWLGTGTVSVNAPAGSAILIDGRLIGKLPLEKRIEVYEGDHHLLVEMGEARWEKDFSILEGEKLNYEVAVERRPRAIAGD